MLKLLVGSFCDRSLPKLTCHHFGLVTGLSPASGDFWDVWLAVTLAIGMVLCRGFALH